MQITITSNVADQNRSALELIGKLAADPTLAQPILNILSLVGNDPSKLASLDTGALKTILNELPNNINPVEEKLRSSNRIQDDPELLAKLGYTGDIPEISPELIEKCANTDGVIVLRFETRLADYQHKLNEALGPNNKTLHLDVQENDLLYLKTGTEKATWVLVPSSVKDETIGLSKTTALEQVQGSEACSPMDLVLMLGYNNLKTFSQMPGFINRSTFTNRVNTLVGSSEDGIVVQFNKSYDNIDSTFRDVGLAYSIK